MIEKFLESGDRLTDKLRKLLKACEVTDMISKPA